MKKTQSVREVRRSFRGLIKQWLSTFIKRQNQGVEKWTGVFEKLESIEESIDVIAREIERQVSLKK